MSRGDTLAVLDAARHLRDARPAGGRFGPLRGKNLALLYEPRWAAGADAVRRAAADLGAQVVQLSLTSTQFTANDRMRDTARILGRLYDAIDCAALAEGLLNEIERDAGVPVFNGLATSEHPSQLLAQLLAMEQCGGKPLDALRVEVRATLDTPLARMFAQAAERTGFELLMVDIHADTSSSPADFRIDATCRPARIFCNLTALNRQAIRLDQHHFVLQAILVATLT